jgi:hypothetical protein
MPVHMAHAMCGNLPRLGLSIDILGPGAYRQADSANGRMKLCEFSSEGASSRRLPLHSTRVDKLLRARCLDRHGTRRFVLNERRVSHHSENLRNLPGGGTAMSDILSTQNNYRSLSIRDLLQARDLYHYHLLNKPNVVGTAIGLYLIRKHDPYLEEQTAQRRRKAKAKRHAGKSERTFGNSEIREYSWPCVHAFVREWTEESEFGGAGAKLHPEDMVPKTLYLPDGRMIPVCVTRVEQEGPDDKPPAWVWPGGIFGGGMPIGVSAQGRDQLATAGCLVSDGHMTYVLTSRHVCGDSGEEVFTLARGRREVIGRGSSLTLSRMPFTDAYPEFVGTRTYVNLDAGLIELDDANAWTSQVVNLTNVGGIADLNELNITTRLIDAPVVAIGAASGRLEGRIKALFYRYKSVGGYDHVADFLIAPRDLDDIQRRKGHRAVQTRPGDSGAVWHLIVPKDTVRRRRKDSNKDKPNPFQGTPRPLAVQWGGQVFGGNRGNERYAFALATNLTTVCRTLNVEVVAQQNTGAMPYWGQMGHYSIASFAVSALKNGRLKNLLKANLESISFDFAELSPKKIKEALKAAKDAGSLIPLADVPDVLWKTHISKVKGGRDTRWAGQGRSTGPEHPTHYADIDERGPNKKTLRQLCLESATNVSVKVWRNFYTDTGHKVERDRGLLPFRVWQFFDELKKFALKKQAEQFLCAAGILSHYVGDACQPLHGSIYSDGYSDKKTTTTHHRRDTREEYTTESHLGAGVHSAYETKMIDRKSTDLVKKLATSVAQSGDVIKAIKSGHDAATRTVELMDRAARRIPPKTLVDAFIAAGGTGNVADQDALWKTFGTKTVLTMADGARVLARIWQAAWDEGGGDAIGDVGAVEPKDLKELYEETTFVESLNLDDIESVLK